jgi:hypothetical protein
MSQDWERYKSNPVTLETKRMPFYRGSLTWPVILITLGLMLLADQFLPAWDFSRTWPVLLVVIGVLKLIDSGRPPRPPEGPRI